MSRRRAAGATAIAVASGALGVLPAAAAVVPPGTLGGFEIEGNQTLDANVPGDLDWENTSPTVISDQVNPDIGFQGSSKEEDPTNWTCMAGGDDPPKANLLRAYADARIGSTAGSDFAYLDLAWVKQEGEGDVHVNFEFNQTGTVGPDAPGPCPEIRLPGDLLVTYDFGGTSDPTSNIRIWRWNGSAWVEITSFDGVAATNTTPITDVIAGGTLETRTFGEASIDLRSAGVGIGCPGFGAVNVRSRSSGESLTSALQDKLPTTAFELSTCARVKLNKTDDQNRPLAGAQFGLFTNAQGTGTAAYTCTSDAAGVCDFGDVDPDKTYWAKETAAPAGYQADATIFGPIDLNFKQDYTVPHVFTNAPILGSLKITKTHALGGLVPGVRFFLLQGGTAVNTAAGTPAACTTGTDGTCTITGLTPGQYTVREDPATVPPSMSAAPDQTVTVVAGQQVSVSFANPVKALDISLEKLVNGQESVTVREGDALQYSLKITNSGQIPLVVTSLADVANAQNVALPAGCTGLVNPTPLAVGASRSCTYPATAPATDVDNTATVVGRDEFGRIDTAQDTAHVDVITPGIDINKTVNGQKTVTVGPGDTVTYELTIQNTGNSAVTVTSLTDVANGTNRALTGTCATLLANLPTLQPNGTATCSYQVTVGGDDVRNTATVTGRDEAGKTVGPAESSATVLVRAASLTIAKTVNGQESVTTHPGDTVTYRVVISNPSDVPVTLTSFTDVARSSVGVAESIPAACGALIGQTIGAGGSLSCTYTGAPTADTVNTATVAGRDRSGRTVGPVEDDATVLVVNPGITITKTVNGQESVIVHAGDTVTYRLVIRNTGSVAVTITTLTDVAGTVTVDLPTRCLSLVGTQLAVGASVECSYNVTAGTDDVTNVATVGGRDDLGREVSDDDDARVDVINPAITIVKTASPTSINGESGTTTFTYVVTNTGDVALTDIVVTDDVLGEIGRVASLAPGQSATLTRDATVTVDRRTNVGTVVGRDPLGRTVTDDDPESVDFVRGAVFERPVAPPPAGTPQAVPPPATGPARVARTGSPTGFLAVVGFGFLAFGVLLVAPTRRRRHHTA